MSNKLCDAVRVQDIISELQHAPYTIHDTQYTIHNTSHTTYQTLHIIHHAPYLFRIEVQIFPRACPDEGVSRLGGSWLTHYVVDNEVLRADQLVVLMVAMST